MKNLFTVLATVLFFAIGCQDTSNLVSASGEIFKSDGELLGSIYATQLSDRVVLTLNLVNDQPHRIRAAHIHYGTCSSLGGHWNMESSESFCQKKSLGANWKKPYAGDIGNVKTNNDGQGKIIIETDLWTIGAGLKSDIDGNVVVIHENESFFEIECDMEHDMDHTHDNPKIACGTILLN